jgi:hypothetical protein
MIRGKKSFTEVLVFSATRQIGLFGETNLGSSPCKVVELVYI